MTTSKLIHVTSSLRMGGAEKVLYTLVKALASQGYNQTVIYVHGGPYQKELEQLGIKTIQISGRFFRYDLFFFIRLYRALRTEQPTVIHSLLWAANVSARLCAWLLSQPIVCAYHNNIEQDGLLRSWCDRLTVHGADRLIAVSEQVADALKQRSWLPAERITIIKNGIDTEQLAQINMLTKQDLGLPDKAYLIGAVGRFVPIKRFDYLITTYAAMHRVDNRYLVIIGSGPDEQELRSLAQTVGNDRVLFMTDVLALPYYQLFDCFVQPSVKEGISLALLEAMYYKRPCVVMGTDQYHPVIQHGHNGLIIDPYDQQALIGALHQLYTDRKYSLMLGQHAHYMVNEQFALPTMIQKYERLFEQIGNR